MVCTRSYITPGVCRRSSEVTVTFQALYCYWPIPTNKITFTFTLIILYIMCILYLMILYKCTYSNLTVIFSYSFSNYVNPANIIPLYCTDIMPSFVLEHLINEMNLYEMFNKIEHKRKLLTSTRTEMIYTLFRPTFGEKITFRKRLHLTPLPINARVRSAVRCERLCVDVHQK